MIESEQLIENRRNLANGCSLFLEMSRRHELIRSVRGKGLMIGIEFGPPRSARLRASWNLLETASSGLFCQLIVIPLFNDQKLLTQVAGHGNHTIKLLPSLTISDEDCEWIEGGRLTPSLLARIARPAPWKLGKTSSAMLYEHGPLLKCGLDLVSALVQGLTVPRVRSGKAEAGFPKRSCAP